MNDSYQVHRSPHGVYVTGSVPLDDIITLRKGWAKNGFKRMSITLCGVLNATMVVVKNQAAEDAWRKELNATPENPDWTKSGDTGTSSKTIYDVLRSHSMPGVSLREGGDVPYDPEDFGRCHRLLKRFPEWRARLGEVAVKHPKWIPFVREWDRMTAIYERDFPHPPHRDPGRRRSAGFESEDDVALQKLIENARSVTMSDAQKEQQRRSFAYGNAKIENPRVTRKGIARAASLTPQIEMRRVIASMPEPFTKDQVRNAVLSANAGWTYHEITPALHGVFQDMEKSGRIHKDPSQNLRELGATRWFRGGDVRRDLKARMV